MHPFSGSSWTDENPVEAAAARGPFSSPTIDLYVDVVLRATEWSTRDYSIKTLAKFPGFRWRDTNPSGSASIEGYDRWVKTDDPAVKAPTLAYNHDDCVVTRVLLEGIRTIG